MSVIQINNLKKYYGKTKAVDGISFEIEKGEIFGFLGPNGAGKTTTIRCLLDFVRPTSGRLSVLGYSLADANFHKSRKQLGYLVAGMNLVESWTGRDHISYQEALCGKSKNIDSLIRRFAFNPKVCVKTLSTGNRQKLGLILALMNNPQVLILDEPTAGLDPLLQEEFYKILKELSFKGVTVFMSSHNLAEVEKICTRVAMIKNGKIVNINKISELEGKKIHSVRVTFKQEVKKSDLFDKNTVISEEITGGYIISVKGSIDVFIKKIAKFQIESISITQANLEEIFLEFYKK